MRFILSLVAIAAIPALCAPLEPLALPQPVDVPTAKKFLSELVVAVDSNVPAYTRDQFGKTPWITVNGCNTRQTVLKRDGTNVVTDSKCQPVSGNWVSVYDGVTTTDSSKLDIDHVVPLKEAWISGARSWTLDQRVAFANDLTRPQLVAVSQSSNRSKGDKDIARWLPPDTAFHCTYARAWVTVKHNYKLTIDTAEQTALTGLLANC